MHKLLTTTLLFFIAFSSQLFAQITLEHTYNFPVTRVRTALGTERYVREPYLDSDDTWKLDIFDGGHNLINTMTLPWTGNLFDIKLWIITDQFFDTDAGIEVMIRRQDSGGNPYMYSFHDDTGAQIGSDYTFEPKLVTLSDGGHKLLLTNSLYSVPALTLEHTFEQGEQNVKYTLLEDGGDVFYTLNSAGQLVFYKPDYSLYTTINTGLNVASTIYNPFVLGQYQVNGDAAIEWQVSYGSGNSFISRFYSGETFISEHPYTVNIFSADYETLLPGSFPGLNGAKSVIQKTNSPGGISVADVNTGTVEFTSAGYWRYGDSYGAGTKFWPSLRVNSATSATVLNADFTEWATFPLSGNDYRAILPTADIFDTDPASKELIVEDDNAFAKFRIENEAGNNLFVTPACTTVVVSRLVNLPNKFLARGIYQTYVYSIPSNGPVSAIKPVNTPPTLDITVAPNPFNLVLSVNLTGIEGKTALLSAYDRSGKQVITSRTVNTGGLVLLPELTVMPSGGYWIRVENESGQYGWIQVIKQ